MNFDPKKMKLATLKTYENFKAFSIDTIVLDEPLAFDLYVDNANRLVKFIKAGDTLLYEKKEKLIQNKVNHFYISTLNSRMFDNYLVSHIGTVLNSPNLDKKQKSSIIYSSAVHIMQDMFESEISQSKIMIAKDIMSETVKQIISKKVTAASILQLSSHDYKTYSHCVNVALYSIGIAHEYGLNENLITEIASGAILHDLGKCEINQCIINKHGKLSLEEFENMKEHPQHSYETLLKNGETNQTILEIVLNHHEKLDGSGYGRALSQKDISFAAQIVTIADIFDALSSNRAYKEASSFYGALKIMKNEMKEQLNITLVDALIKMMGKA
jgi:putative nucleotidyltransferase with HDIG domain